MMGSHGQTTKRFGIAPVILQEGAKLLQVLPAASVDITTVDRDPERVFKEGEE